MRVAADGEGGDMHCPCTYVGVPPTSTAACTDAHVTARQLPPSPLTCRVPHPLCAGVPRPPAAAGAAAHPRPEAAPSVPSTGSLPGLGARVAQPQPRQARGLHGCDLHYAPAPGLPRHLAAGERRGVGGCAGERRRRGGRKGGLNPARRRGLHDGDPRSDFFVPLLLRVGLHHLGLSASRHPVVYTFPPPTPLATLRPPCRHPP